MADQHGDEVSSEGGHNPYASQSKWRHQESSAYARYAATSAGQARDTEGVSGSTKDLRDFLNASRITPEESAAAGVTDGHNAALKFTPIVVPDQTAAGQSVADQSVADQSVTNQSVTVGVDGPADATHAPPGEVIAGPLLNYRRMEGDNWIGSALVVTRGGGKNPGAAPTLRLGPAESDSAATQTIEGVCLFSDPRNTFWRFDLAVPLGASEARWQYSLPGLRYASETKPRTSVFSVPAASESMRLLFFSCNGFSVGTDEDAWCGPALWNDVLRVHAQTPFHVMIGGGDQIYNDGIRVHGPLREWTAISNPKKRRDYPFSESLRARCDEYYLQNYIRWYSTEPFATANGQIPQLNIWDDHDIIDGFGSYVNEFMKCDVFRGIGGSAHKYYMLFQHHLPPPVSTYTSDAPQAGEAGGVDPKQLVDTFVGQLPPEPNYIIGKKPGPYVAEHSHNMYAKLGARMAFLGLDARTERTRHQVNYPETYDQIFSRVDQELSAEAASGQPIRHLILLLGIPIAYPRLTWLENVLGSPLMGPIKFMNKRFGVAGGFINYFDGSVDLLDDLDDHYTARTHKKERNQFVERLQTVCAAHSVRITILGGDVHLAALGRFYSNPSLGVPTENDHRFMVNVVSSAITNKPPPAAIANLLSRRNKIHHLNPETDETLFKLFDKDPGNSTKTAGHNNVTMPSRNFAMITENSPNNRGGSNGVASPAAERLHPEAANGGRGAVGNGHTRPGLNSHSAVDVSTPSKDPAPPRSAGRASLSGTSTKSRGTGAATATGKNGHYALHAGEEGAGTKHRAAGPQHGTLNDGSLDVCFRVEIDQHDTQGHTEGYGLSIPALDYTAPPPVPAIPAHFRPETGTSS